MVGATATGTHGTGASLPILSDGVVRMELIDGRGEAQVLAAGDPALSTARVHLGALGLVTRVSLRTVPARRLHERLVNLPLEAALERLPELLNHAHARLWWLLQTGVVQVYTADPTEDPDTGPTALPVRMDRWGLQAPLLRFLLGLGLAWPALVPSIHRFAQATNFRARERVEAQHHVLTLAVPPRHDEVEVAFGIEDAADLIAELWRMSHRDGRCPDFIQEVRFVRGDTAALSPAHGRDSVYLGAYCTNPRVAAPYHADLLALARQVHGRPHWGKRFDHTAAELAPLYPAGRNSRRSARASTRRGSSRAPGRIGCWGPSARPDGADQLNAPRPSARRARAPVRISVSDRRSPRVQEATSHSLESA